MVLYEFPVEGEPVIQKHRSDDLPVGVDAAYLHNNRSEVLCYNRRIFITPNAAKRLVPVFAQIAKMEGDETGRKRGPVERYIVSPEFCQTVRAHMEVRCFSSQSLSLDIGRGVQFMKTIFTGKSRTIARSAVQRIARSLRLPEAELFSLLEKVDSAP